MDLITEQKFEQILNTFYAIVDTDSMPTEALDSFLAILETAENHFKAEQRKLIAENERFSQVRR